MGKTAIDDLRLAVSAVAMTITLALAGAAEGQQQPTAWDQLPRMQLERQYAGPLQDTIIQRWRDPLDGTICYVYLPMTAAQPPPTSQAGSVQYGSNSIGSISCTIGSTAPAAPRATAPTAGAATPRVAQPKAPVPPTPPKR